MTNQGYYLWKDDEEEKVPGLNLPVEEKPAPLEKVQSSSSITERDKLDFVEKMRILEKHGSLLGKWFAFFVLTLGIFFARDYTPLYLDPLMWLLAAISAYFTIHYFRREENPPLKLEELKELKNKCLMYNLGTEDDAYLIDSHIQRIKRNHRLDKAR